jgi:hypothetical protein
MKIITHYRNPPIPVRSFDWTAYFEGQEDCLVGCGKTELQALFDLYSQYTDQEQLKQDTKVFTAFREAFAKALDKKPTD